MTSSEVLRREVSGVESVPPRHPSSDQYAAAMKLAEMAMATVESSSSPNGPSHNATPSASTPASSKDESSFDAQVASLSAAIAAVVPKVARSAVRQNWRKCLVGGKGETAEETKSDESFLARAILKHGNEYVLRRVVEEYGTQLLSHAPEATLAGLMRSHGSALLAVATPEILDEAIEIRLATIDGNQLVKMLAKANRLGYLQSDEVDEEDESGGVVPNGEDLKKIGIMPKGEGSDDGSDTDVMEIDPPQQQPTARDGNGRHHLPELYFAPPLPHHQVPSNVPLPGSADANGASRAQIVLTTRGKAPNHVPGSKHICPDCGASFTQSAGLRYHTANRVCTKDDPPSSSADHPFVCNRCNKGFTNRKGYMYHLEKNVCGSHETAMATPIAPAAYSPSQPNPSYYSNGTPNTTPPGYQQNPKQLPLPSLPPPHLPPPNPSQYPSHGPGQEYRSMYGRTLPYPSNPQNHVPPHVQQSQYNPHLQSQPQNGPSPNYPDFRISTGSSRAPGTPLRQSLPNNPSPPSSIQLDPEKLTAMNEKLAKEAERFEKVLREIPSNLTAVERDEEINKHKRGHATRKSQIRKQYGIQVRKSKLRPANAVTTPQGELDLTAISTGSATRSSTPGSVSIPTFASINRFETFRAPAPSPLASHVPIAASSRPGPLLENDDSKRRRVDSSAADGSTLRIVGYIPKPPKLASAPLENGRQPLPSGIDVDPSAQPVVEDTSRRNPAKETPSEDSQSGSVSPRAASVSASVSASVPAPTPDADTAPLKPVPVEAAQKQWETIQASTPVRVVNTPDEPAEPDTPTSPVNSESAIPISIEKAPKSPELAPRPSDAVSIHSEDSGSDSDDGDIPARMPTPKAKTPSLSPPGVLKRKKMPTRGSVRTGGIVKITRSSRRI